MSANTVATIAKMGVATLGLALASAALGTANQAGGGSDKPVATQAATAVATGATVDADKMKKGKDLFGSWSCNSCHSLADAGSTGHVGPAFDGDTNLSEAFVKDRVTNGQGPMPAFGGQMTPEEIDTVAYYVVHAAQK